MNCNLEVAPETLALDAPLVERTATWTSLYDAIYRLWLDSAEYEAWAKRELSGLSSAVTTRGRRVQRALNAVCRCYFWYFQDQAADTFRPLTACPSCQQPLRTYIAGIFRQSICEDCSLVTVGE